MRKSQSDSAALEDFKAKAYTPPKMDSVRRADIIRASTLHANAGANRSDPFARDRITAHMKRGLELPSDVIADAQRLTNAGQGHEPTP